MWKTALTLLATAFIGALHAELAQAQPTRVFVAAQGSDGNPCSFAQPCRTFQHAHDAVAAGGEIDVLDPAGYGALTITKSVSIQGYGFAGISAPNLGNGIFVSATAADDVSLNGVLIQGNGSIGQSGIFFLAARSLLVENCVAQNVGFAGIRVESNASTAQTLAVSSSSFANNGYGIYVSPNSSGAIAAVIERIGLYRNGSGMYIDGQHGTGALGVAVTDSVSSNNTSFGFVVGSTAGHSVANLALTRVTATGNNVGIQSGGTNATLRIAQSTITQNATGYAVFAPILSLGDNFIDGNAGNSGMLTSVARQ